MAKYEPLRDYLLRLPEDVREKTLTFAEVERILGAKLPASAHRYDQWWENEYSKHGHVQAQAWQTAGWVKDHVSRREKWVRFRRAGTERDEE